MVGPEQSVIPASVVEGPCLAAAVTGGTEQGEGPQVVRDRLCEAVLIPEQAAQPGVSFALADRVAQFREQVQSLLKVGVSLVVTAKPPAGNAEARMRVSLADRSSWRRAALRAVCWVAAQSSQRPWRSEHHERPRELPRVGVPPGGGCLFDGGEQHGVLGVEPCPRRGAVGRFPGSTPGGGGGKVRVLPADEAGAKRRARCAGSDRVPGLSPPAARPRCHERGLLDGVGAQQIVEGEPAGTVLGDQVRLGQLGQCRALARSASAARLAAA